MPVLAAERVQWVAFAKAMPAPDPSFDIGQATDVGRVREANEDALLALAPTSDRVLVAVADGMGGHQAGEVASALAVESLRTALSQADASAPASTLLAQAVDLANRTIWDAAALDAAKEGMGTTLVCALVDQSGAASIANVGDSRAYLVSPGQTSATLVTSDHTWVNEQVQAGVMSAREAQHSPYRNLLTRSLGGMPSVQMDLFDLGLQPGDALVLVSDGVTGYLDEQDMAAVLEASPTAQAAAEQLVAEAVARGGADNATAVVLLLRRRR